MKGDLHMKNYTLGELRALAKERKIPGYTKYGMLEFDFIAGKGKQKGGQTPPNTNPQHSIKPPVPKMSPHQKKPPVPKIPPHPKKQSLLKMPPHPKKPPVPKVLTPKKLAKPKEQHEMTQSTTDWFDLPLDLKLDILNRIDAVEILWSVQKVCTDWYKTCKDPSMWRVIYMSDWRYPRYGSYNFPSDQFEEIGAREMCKNIVDRSQGHLVDITIVGFCDDELLEYIADRSPNLIYLEIKSSEFKAGTLIKALKKLPKLEELSILCDQALCNSYCSQLKTLELTDCPNIGDLAIRMKTVYLIPGCRRFLMDVSVF